MSWDSLRAYLGCKGLFPHLSCNSQDVTKKIFLLKSRCYSNRFEIEIPLVDKLPRINVENELKGEDHDFIITSMKQTNNKIIFVTEEDFNFLRNQSSNFHKFNIEFCLYDIKWPSLSGYYSLSLSRSSSISCSQVNENEKDDWEIIDDNLSVNSVSDSISTHSKPLLSKLSYAQVLLISLSESKENNINNSNNDKSISLKYKILNNSYGSYKQKEKVKIKPVIIKQNVFGDDDDDIFINEYYEEKYYGNQ